MADVTIYGAGIFGLSIAWACTMRGARVQVIDPYGIAAGSSGGLVGALAPHVPENWNTKKAFQFSSLQMSEAFWSEISEISGRDPGYARLGRLQPIVDDAGLALAQARARSAAELWGDFAAWSVEPAAGDWCPPSPTGWVIRDTLSGRVHPRQACFALAKALVKKGALITEAGTEKGVVVHATGWKGLQELQSLSPRSVGGGVKGQALLLGFDARRKPQLFSDSLHIVPHADGTTAIGSTSERDFADPQSTDDQLEAVYARALKAFPVLSDAPILERWAGVRPRARSRAPMLGAWPDRPGHFIANGGFKIGFGMAPKISQVMADLVLEGVDAIPEGFRIEDNL